MSEKGIKYDGDKARVDLIPTVGLMEVGKVLGAGANKYAPNNWKKVEGARWRYFGAALRHLFQYKFGPSEDEETGLSHLAHAACCILFMLAYDLGFDQTDEEWYGEEAWAEPDSPVELEMIKCCMWNWTDGKAHQAREVHTSEGPTGLTVTETLASGGFKSLDKRMPGEDLFSSTHYTLDPQGRKIAIQHKGTKEPTIEEEQTEPDVPVELEMFTCYKWNSVEDLLHAKREVHTSEGPTGLTVKETIASGGFKSLTEIRPSVSKLLSTHYTLDSEGRKIAIRYRHLEETPAEEEELELVDCDIWRRLSYPRVQDCLVYTSRGITGYTVRDMPLEEKERLRTEPFNKFMSTHYVVDEVGVQIALSPS